jgi:hypothetical protein
VKTPKTIIVVLIIIAMVALPGCYKEEFKGRDVDLFTVARNSILGLQSYSAGEIVIMDEDQYGRRMFLFRGVTTATENTWEDPSLAYSNVYAVLISQKTDGNYVYFIPDNNSVLVQGFFDDFGPWPSGEDYLQLVYSKGINAEIEELKRANDWNRPLNEDKLVRAKILRTDNQWEAADVYVSSESREVAFLQVAKPGDDFLAFLFYYFITDEYGRHLYFFRTMDEDNVYTGSYVVIFNRHGSFDRDTGIMEITDVYNYQDDLRVFKERNGWNTPLT